MSTTIAAGRLAVVRHLIVRLQQDPALSGVSVWHGWPGDSDVSAEMLWTGEITGDCDIPVLTGSESRHPRSDEWQIDWYSRVAGAAATSPQQAVAVAHDRLASIAGAVENLAADDPTLDEQDTLIAAVITRIEQAVTRTPEGPVGFGHLILSCESRLD